MMIGAKPHRAWAHFPGSLGTAHRPCELIVGLESYSTQYVTFAAFLKTDRWDIEKSNWHNQHICACS